MKRPLRIGVGPSVLAQLQAGRIQDRLRRAGIPAESIELHPPIETDLIGNRIDLSVVQFDQLAGELPSSLALAAIDEREEPRGALVSRGAMPLASIPSGARIGVEGRSQQGQLLSARPDLVVECGGDLESLLARFHLDSDLAAIVVPMTTLQWLEPGYPIGELLSAQILVPPVGQGSLAVVTRADDADTIGAVRTAIHDPRAAACVRAERAVQARLGVGIGDPVGAFASWAELGEPPSGWLELVSRVVSSDGERMVEGVITELVDGELEAEQLGTRLADDLLAQGAMDILAEP